MRLLNILGIIGFYAATIAVSTINIAVAAIVAVAYLIASPFKAVDPFARVAVPAGPFARLGSISPALFNFNRHEGGTVQRSAARNI